MFGGSAVQWRALCDLYPSAESPDIIMAVVEYCAVRSLDPYKKPVHIVPMWNSKLKRRVQVVMQGIAEIMTIAARTGEWAGMDEPIWGPETTRTFTGTQEDERTGETRETKVELTFRESCMVPVWRLVKGERARFVEPVFWIEAYGRDGFRSAVPNQRWQIAPLQMLHKCAKAAVLRAAFPEQGFPHVAEEMDGQEMESGGVTLDGAVDYGPPDDLPRDPHDAKLDEREPGIETLSAKDRTWLNGLELDIASAGNAIELDAVEDAGDVQQARANAPLFVRRQIDEWITAARAKLADGK